MGEWLALGLLVATGHRPRHRNWRTPGGELDLVVERRREVVFVEVKSRSSTDYGGAVAAVDAAKRRRMVRAAAAYLTRHGLWDRPCRFDVLTLQRHRDALLVPWRLRHYRYAFRADLGRRL